MKSKSHWHHAILTFALTVLAAGVLLPLVRIQPESVHKYVNGLNHWIRIIFTFSLCVVFAGAMFKLFSPRFGHLAHWWSYPPSWLAAVLAWIVVAVVDVKGWFDTDGYRATMWQWLGYGGGSILVAGWYSGFWSEIVERLRKPENVQAEAKKCITLQNIENTPWEEIEAWLKSDEPARYDFLGSQSVAERVSHHVSKGTRSVGIIGPYGVGKTSIVTWITERLKSKENLGKFFVCYHSCWGFETSASAIRDMLGSAIAKLSAEIDTFQVDSLPESYLQTFSSVGDWVEKILKIIQRNPDPMEQFSRLSDLLGEIGGRMVFIVEDLDRNETRNFEIQEVLAFLERLKKHPNFSFILTGGVSSSKRIDYAKLCDHIEILRTIQPQQSSALIKRVRQRCLDSSFFQHLRLGDPNPNDDWDPLTGRSMQKDDEELSRQQAVASLLNTPRFLRHALGRTFSAWRILYGEIDFNHLLVVNILRSSAPECFQFLIRRWHQLKSPPEQRPTLDPESVKRIRQAIIEDWNHTIQNVEWNPAAALQVTKFILPATEYWLVNDTRQKKAQSGKQHVSEERYWIRSINEEIEADDVRDQEVFRHIQAWLDSPGTATDLVTKLTSSHRYADIWEYLADRFFVNRPNEILLLCEQVIKRILSEKGSSATETSLGFIHTWRFSRQKVFDQETISTWLKTRISEAVRVSLQMANDIWYFYGDHRHFFIRAEDMQKVREHMLDAVRANVTDSESLITRLSSNTSATLYQLVFDPRRNQQSILADVKSWIWLGPMILDGVRRRDLTVAANCVVLLGTPPSAHEQMTVNTEVLDQFFGDDATEVIDILETMIDQLSEGNQSFIRNIVGAARKHLAGGIWPVEQKYEADAE